MPKPPNKYADVIGYYILKTYGERGIAVYSQVPVGTSLLGTGRTIDLLLIEKTTNKIYGLECKYQGGDGTAYEKLIYTLEDLESLRIPGCLVYAGGGFPPHIRHHLMASPSAAYCLPSIELKRNFSSPTWNNPSPFSTRQLDLSLAVYFDWWDILLRKRDAFVLDERKIEIAYKTLNLDTETPPEHKFLADNEATLREQDDIFE